MFEGKDPKSIRMFLSLFVHDICEKSAICLASLADAQDELRKEKTDVTQVFQSIQTALLHSSFISLAFWPQKNKSKKRGQYLRSGFQCPNSVDFFKARQFRNHIAHLDERLDDWWLTSQNHNIARKIIGGGNAIVGLPADDMFERFDPTTGELFFRGDRYQIDEFWQHCSNIYFEAEKLSRFSWWDDKFVQAFEIEK